MRKISLSEFRALKPGDKLVYFNAGGTQANGTVDGPVVDTVAVILDDIQDYGINIHLNPGDRVLADRSELWV